MTRDRPVEIPDDLLCLFTGRVESRRDSYVIEVPKGELERGAIEAGDVYRVAVFPGLESGEPESASRPVEHPEPPVEEGDVRTVEIEGIGDQGDGIARVDRGYVVIVPDTDVGDEVEVEIEETRPNFAMASVLGE